jgi:hypothetical protein
MALCLRPSPATAIKHSELQILNDLEHSNSVDSLKLYSRPENVHIFQGLAIAISMSLLEAKSKFLVSKIFLSTTKTWIKCHYLYVTTNTLKCILKYIYDAFQR